MFLDDWGCLVSYETDFLKVSVKLDKNNVIEGRPKLTTMYMYPYTREWLIAPIMHVVQKFISYLSTLMKWDEGKKKHP